MQRTDHLVESDQGIMLAVREVAPDGDEGHGPPLVMLHGARVPSVASFDLDVPGGSLAADLAKAGHRVFAMDIRGYGGSTRPPEMERAPAAEPSIARSADAAMDISAVADFACARTGQQTVALFGWATGGHWIGQYASASPSRVSHAIFHNALYGRTDGHDMLGRGTGNDDPARPGTFNRAEVGNYRLSTSASVLAAWANAIPVADLDQWRDPEVARAYAEAALASDPTSPLREPPSFRAPSGAMEDSFYLAIGHQLWDATLITAHCLVLRSSRDFWSRAADLELLSADLVNAASVRTVELQDATHHVHLDRPDRGRDRLIDEITRLLAK
jgi:pimeloyl-ACP methyl ester carboxylesterase